jgi:hypothetical protein
MPVDVIDRDTFEAFLDELRNRPAIRVVKLADYGFVAPLKTSSGAIVMAPQVKIVATAYDKDGNSLIRWQSARPATSTVTVGIGTARGIHGDVQVVAKKDDLRKWLELEGYSVSDGEWTRDEIDRLVARRAESARGR